MEKLLEKFFDFNKIPTKVIFVLWVISAILIFVPEGYLAKLNLTQFNADYGKYIGIVLLVSSGILMATLFTWISNSIQSGRFHRKRKADIIKLVNSLDSHEKAVLREFAIKGSSTLQLPITEATVTGLHSKGIIYQVSNTGFSYIHGHYFPYSINEIALREINHNSGLIGYPSIQDGMTNEIWQDLLRQRPRWAIDKDRFDSL